MGEGRSSRSGSAVASAESGRRARPRQRPASIAWRSISSKRKMVAWPAPRLPQRRGDERRPRQPQKRDGKVAERGHHLGSRPPADLGAVFVEGDVPHPVEAVLDRPVGADEGEEASRGRLGRRQAGHPVHGLAVRRARRELGDGAVQTEDLADVGEVKVGVEGRAGPEVADLQPAVALLRRRGLRGEKRPAGARQCRRGAWAGSP